MKARVSALWVRQARASSASRTSGVPSAARGIFASPATRASPTTLIRTEPYELTATAARATPPIRPPIMGRGPSGSRITPMAIPTRTAMNHQERGAVRRSS